MQKWFAPLCSMTIKSWCQNHCYSGLDSHPPFMHAKAQHSVFWWEMAYYEHFDIDYIFLVWIQSPIIFPCLKYWLFPTAPLRQTRYFCDGFWWTLNMNMNASDHYCLPEGWNIKKSDFNVRLLLLCFTIRHHFNFTNTEYRNRRCCKNT